MFYIYSEGVVFFPGFGEEQVFFFLNFKKLRGSRMRLMGRGGPENKRSKI